MSVPTMLAVATGAAFSDAEREAVYRAIFERRDMLHFAGGTVSPDVMRRLLTAVHHAPSVGYMQPWRFVRVATRALRADLKALVEQERTDGTGSGRAGRGLHAPEGRGPDGCRRSLGGGPGRGPGTPRVRAAHIAADGSVLPWPAPSRICGWRPAPKAWAWAVCRCSTPRPWPPCWACPRGPNRWPCCASAPFTAFTTNPCWSKLRWGDRAVLDNLLFEDRWGQALGTTAQPLR